MAINPIQNIEVVEKGNIISAASDMPFLLENSINGKSIYHKNYTLSADEISSFSDLYNNDTLEDLSSFLKNELSNDNFNIKRGEIIRGNNTFNWIDTCYKKVSEIRWCRFLYKNSNYSTNIGFNPTDANISSEHIFALSLDAFVYLSSSAYTSAVVEKNNLSENGWQKCGGGKDSNKNFLLTNDLSSYVSVNIDNFKIGTLIEASDINNTIPNYNSILDLTKKAKDLSCEFCNGKNVYNYFYDKDSEDSGDNLKNAISVKFVLFSNSDNFQYIYSVFDFIGDYRNLSENGKAILNEDSWRRLSNKQSNTLSVGESNWDNHRLFSNIEFSLADLGIRRINVDFTFNDWHIIRTDKDKTELSDATSYLSSTDNTRHVRIAYSNIDNKNKDFNSIKDVKIGINLSQPNSRYWIIPDISVTVLKPIIKSLNGIEITDTKGLPESQFGELLSTLEYYDDGEERKTRKTYIAFSYGDTNHVGNSFSDTSSSNKLSENTNYYGITRKLLGDANGNYRDNNGMLKYDNSTNKFWKALTSTTDINRYMTYSDYETIPISAFITVIFGTNIWSKQGSFIGTKSLDLTASIYKSNGTINSKSVNDKIKYDQDPNTFDNLRSHMKTSLYNENASISRYITFDYSGDTSDVNEDGEYFIGNVIFRSTKLITLERL